MSFESDSKENSAGCSVRFLLQGWKPPPLTHKYSLLSQKPYETFNGGLEWRVDGSQFPISTTMTGVVLEMDAGALRELHWHPNAAE